MMRTFFDTNVLVYLFDNDAPAKRALTLPVVPIDPPLVLQAARTSRLQTLSYLDALIVESAQGAGATRLLTEDLQPGRRFGDLEIENPFAEL